MGTSITEIQNDVSLEKNKAQEQIEILNLYNLQSWSIGLKTI